MDIETPFYKKLPIIPVIILFLLMGAWAFRWDYKMTQTYDGGNKIVHKVDRWTGNHWYELYGEWGWGWKRTMYSGAERPCLKTGKKAEGKQIYDIEHRRTRATVIWYIVFLSTAGYIVYKIRKP